MNMHAIGLRNTEEGKAHMAAISARVNGGITLQAAYQAEATPQQKPAPSRFSL